MLQPTEAADTGRYLSLPLGLGLDEAGDEPRLLFYAARRLLEGAGLAMLIREVAYGTVPRTTRRERHAAAAGHIEDTLESASELLAPPVLAYHWREAGEPQRAVPYLLAAAEAALRAWARGAVVELLARRWSSPRRTACAGGSGSSAAGRCSSSATTSRSPPSWRSCCRS